MEDYTSEIIFYGAYEQVCVETCGRARYAATTLLHAAAVAAAIAAAVAFAVVVAVSVAYSAFLAAVVVALLAAPAAAAAASSTAAWGEGCSSFSRRVPLAGPKCPTLISEYSVPSIGRYTCKG